MNILLVSALLLIPLVLLFNLRQAWVAYKKKKEANQALRDVLQREKKVKEALKR